MRKEGEEGEAVRTEGEAKEGEGRERNTGGGRRGRKWKRVRGEKGRREMVKGEKGYRNELKKQRGMTDERALEEEEYEGRKEESDM